MASPKKKHAPIRRSNGRAKAKTTARRKTPQTIAEIKRVLSGALKTTAPLSRVLPGMERVRDELLDNMFEVRAVKTGIMNESRRDIKALDGGILQRMQDLEKAGKTIYVYKHSGLEGARVPGSERLRMRLVKDQGNAEVAGEAGADNADEGVDEPIFGEDVAAV